MGRLERTAKSTARWVGRVRGDNPIDESIRKFKAYIGSRLSPSDFWYGRYPHTFLERRPPEDPGSSALPEVIWTLWLGENELTPGRRKGIESIRTRNPDLRVELITPDRLDELVVPGYPLHPAYANLSLNHRSDYMRAYLLHHHGGGYADIKSLVGPWLPAFQRLAESDSWLVGRPLTDPKWAGNSSGRLQTHLRRYYRLVVFGSVLIAKSHTPLTAEWIREVDRLLDYYAPALQETPGNMWGNNAGYPIPWMGLQGSTLQPLCLKYQSRIIHDESISWDMRVAYR